MKYIDLHCDTLMHTWKEEPGNDIVSNTVCSIDMERLKRSGAAAQFFAIFMLHEENFEKIGRPVISDEAYIQSLIEQLKRGIAKTDGIQLAMSSKDLSINEKNEEVSTFLTIEDGRSIDSIETLERYFSWGIRLVSLTWNYENGLGYPNSKNAQEMQRPLKPFGIEVVRRMNELGMLVDVSHLSDGGFYDVVKYSDKPFVASHSNARALTHHPRNLTDEMIRVLADRGGVMGLNYCSAFLTEDGSNLSRITDMIRHLNHIKKIGGTDILALGSDFDGIGGELELDSCDKQYLLFEALEQDGWKTEEIEKLAYRNARRVIKESMK